MKIATKATLFLTVWSLWFHYSIAGGISARKALTNSTMNSEYSFAQLSAVQRFELSLMEESFPDSTIATAPKVQTSSGLSSRRITALILSTVVPGAGQTMLGDPYKGAGFTLAAFGSLLTAVISHNNFIARGERLDALEYDYSKSTNWTDADLIYKAMKDSHNSLKSDRNRRNTFLVIAAVIWAANIVDVLYNTEDKGEKAFSQTLMNERRYTTEIPATNDYHSGLLSVSIPLGK